MFMLHWYDISLKHENGTSNMILGTNKWENGKSRVQIHVHGLNLYNPPTLSKPYMKNLEFKRGSYSKFGLDIDSFAAQIRRPRFTRQENMYVKGRQRSLP